MERRAAAVAFVAIVSIAAVGAGLASSRAAAAQPAGQAPAAVDRPDLNGLWQALGNAHWDLEDHAARRGPLFQLGAVGAIPAGRSVVEGGVIPYRPEALARRKDNLENWMTRDPEVKCYLPGIPRATYMPFPFQIVQGTHKIMMIYEYAAANRTIHMDRKVQAPIDTWMGVANGRWDGDTLVVDNTGFNDQTWFDRSGNYHSEALHVVERFTPAGPDHLQYEATIDDPKVFTRAWTISLPLYRRIDKTAEILEFKCPAFAEDVLYGHLRKKPVR